MQDGVPRSTPGEQFPTDLVGGEDYLLEVAQALLVVLAQP